MGLTWSAQLQITGTLVQYNISQQTYRVTDLNVPYRNNWVGLALAKSEIRLLIRNQIEATPVTNDLVVFIIQIRQYKPRSGLVTIISAYCCVHDGHVDPTLTIQNMAQIDQDYPEQSLKNMGRFVVRFNLKGHPKSTLNTAHQIFKNYTAIQ